VGGSGTAFNVSGGTGNVSFGGPIISSSGNAVNVTGRTSDTVSLSGAITETGSGISLTGNSGATITFTGAIAATTGANAAFTATGGGTVTSTDAASTLSTTTATALNVANTTIGVGGLRFRSITAGTAASGPVSGIILNNTGASGGLTVSGTGGAGTGGTIQKTSGPGVLATSTSALNLSSMNVQNGTDIGISGTSVAGLTLSSMSVTNNGDAVAEDGIYLSNLSGTATITGTTVTGSAHNNMTIDNTTGTLASLAISTSTFSSNGAAFGNNGVLVQIRGTSTVTSATISGCTFASNQSTGLQVTTGDTATISAFTVTGSTFTTNNIAMDFAKAQTSNLSFAIQNNPTITGNTSHAINVFTAAGAGTTGNLRGRITGNGIGNAGVAGSGSATGNGIRVNINGSANAWVLVDNNTIRQCPLGRGIEAIGRNGTGGLDVTVTNNNVNPQDTSGFPLAAIFVQSNCVATCNTVRSDIRLNTVPAGASADALPTYIALVETGASTSQLVNTTGSATCTAQLSSTNTGSASASAGCSLIAGPISVP
jgi:hypothetical protein